MIHPLTWKLAADTYSQNNGYALAVQTVPAPWMYNATVVANHDADTVTVDIVAGPLADATLRVPIRVLGINARELSQPGGKEARDYVTSILPTGTKVVLTTASADKYAPRVDAAISFEYQGAVVDLGALLVSEQWAAAYSGSGPMPVPPWPRPVSA